MQLVAYGAQDVYLTGNPQITFWKVTYKRHTNFSMESIEQVFNGCCDFAIAIRSIFANNEGGFVQAGAGIVFDSISDNELKETEYKANAMITALKEASKWNFWLLIIMIHLFIISHKD